MGGYKLRKKLILSLILLSILFNLTDGFGFNNLLTNQHYTLFKLLSDKVNIEKKELYEFDGYINQYRQNGMKLIGKPALFYSPNIAIVNGSIAVGYAIAKNEKTISMNTLEIVNSNFSNLYPKLFNLPLSWGELPNQIFIELTIFK